MDIFFLGIYHQKMGEGIACKQKSNIREGWFDGSYDWLLT